jgi:hypothetical protein
MTTALRDALAKLEQQAIRQKQRTSTILRHPRTGEKTVEGNEISQAVAVEPELT